MNDVFLAKFNSYLRNYTDFCEQCRNDAMKKLKKDVEAKANWPTHHEFLALVGCYIFSTTTNKKIKKARTEAKKKFPRTLRFMNNLTECPHGNYVPVRLPSTRR